MIKILITQLIVAYPEIPWAITSSNKIAIFNKFINATVRVDTATDERQTWDPHAAVKAI